MASAEYVEVDQTSLPSIRESLEGLEIFLTGATGFVGKAFVEKVLRSVPNVGRIYVLARGKKDKTAQERIDAIFASSLFARCREEHPDFTSKVTVISGDINEEGLGISEEDVQMMAGKVSVIIHSAAQVRFDQHLKYALRSNLVGTQRMVELARKFRSLKTFVHVSTAYVNCHNPRTDEKVYKTEYPPQELMNAMEWMDEGLIEKITPHLLQGRPNTYLLTKQLTEHWLLENATDLPICFYRPSVVCPTYSEPFEGWCDTLYGPMGFIVAMGKGLLRTILMDVKTELDILPLDICVNMLVAITWRMLVQPPKELMIFHGCSTPINPNSYGYVHNTVCSGFREYPYNTIYARPRIHFHQSHMVYRIEKFLFHMVPAYIYDAALWVAGQKPQLVRLYRNIHAGIEATAYFRMMDFEWQMDSYQGLLDMMSQEDRQTFNFDMKSIDWNLYWKRFVIGTKQFILREDMSEENIQKAKKQYITMRMRRFMWNAVVALALSRVLSNFTWIRQWATKFLSMLKLSIQTFPIMARILMT